MKKHLLILPSLKQITMIQQPIIKPREVRIFTLQCGLYPNMTNLLAMWRVMMLTRLSLEDIYSLENNQ